MHQETVIPAVERALLKAELVKNGVIRTTRKGENEIYIVNVHNAPNIIREIGRLREISFRDAGGGTGLSLDLDEYDTNEICYEQLIVWSPEDEEIIGGYRFILCKNAIEEMMPKFISLKALHGTLLKILVVIESASVQDGFVSHANVIQQHVHTPPPTVPPLKDVLMP